MLDTHCHLNDSKFDNCLDEVVNNFLSVGINYVICVGWDIESSKKAENISRKYKEVFYAIGVHPDECNNYDEQELIKMISNKTDKMVAIGEIGLDYFHNKDNKEKQKEVFVSQIKLAKANGLPIIIHCREAFGDTIEILKKYAPFENGAVMHCYSGSLQTAKELIKLGIKLSFTGTVTYKNAKNLKEVAKNIPLDSFFFETDSPYLTPEPNRGKRNEPKYVIDVAKNVAELRDVDPIELIKITDNNSKKFFNICG